MKQILANTAPIHFIMVFLGLVTVVSMAWLWFIVTQPGKWSQLVDKENDFWVSKGLVSASASQWFRRFEKGAGQKILVAAVMLLAAGGLIYLAVHYGHPHPGHR